MGGFPKPSIIKSRKSIDFPVHLRYNSVIEINEQAEVLLCVR
jgi:hypothetical protein